jgi:UDP-N-acetylmuramate dehydrogenase
VRRVGACHHRGRAGRRGGRRRTPPVSRCWSSVAASNWGGRRRLRGPGRRGRDHRCGRRHTDACDVDTLAACGGLVLTVAAGEDLGPPGRPRRRERVGRHRGASGIPGRVGATPDPERRRLRQEVDADDRPVRTWTAGSARSAPSALPRRVRLPPQPLQGPRPDRYVVLEVTFPAPGKGDLGSRSRTPSWPAASGVARGARTARGRARGRAGAARGKGHGARRRRTPDTWSAGSFFTNPFLTASRRGAPRDAPRWPQPGRHDQDERRLADRARRVRQGHTSERPGPGCGSPPSTPSR